MQLTSMCYLTVNRHEFRDEHTERPAQNDGIAGQGSPSVGCMPIGEYPSRPVVNTIHIRIRWGQPVLGGETFG